MTVNESFLNHCKELKAKRGLSTDDVVWINSISRHDDIDFFLVEDLLERRITEFTLAVIKERLHGTPKTIQTPKFQLATF